MSPTTLSCDGFQRYVPVFERRWRHYARPVGTSWRGDETYIRVGGRWTYLYRAVDKQGLTVDFWLSEHRDIESVKQFFTRARRRHGVPERSYARRLPRDPCCCRRVEGGWSAALRDEGLDEQVFEQSRRAGASTCEARHLPDARFQEVRKRGSNDQRDRVGAEDQKGTVQHRKFKEGDESKCAADLGRRYCYLTPNLTKHPHAPLMLFAPEPKRLEAR